ncbi:MAG: hypothetical protein H5T66_09325 [Chloroflexi bacterium]|nr:hypothetical protein [Chloroflexota bacterium]
MNEKLFLIGDFVTGTWDEVARAWCEATGQEALCLVANEDLSTAYLVIARYEEQLHQALEAFGAGNLPLIWINDYNGKVVRYPSVSVARFSPIRGKGV